VGGASNGTPSKGGAKHDFPKKRTTELIVGRKGKKKKNGPKGEGKKKRSVTRDNARGNRGGGESPRG